MSERRPDLVEVNEKLQIGDDGPILNRAGTDLLQVKDKDDSALARLQVGNPVSDDDVVNYRTLKNQADIAVVGEIYDSSGETQFPASANVDDIYIAKDSVGGKTVNRLYRCTTAGVVGVAVFEEIPEKDGVTITTTNTLSNGSFSLTDNHVYLYDLPNTTWIDIGPAAAVSGVVKVKKFTLDFNSPASNNIGTPTPSDGEVVDVQITIVTPFDGGASVEIGDAGDTDRLVASSKIKLNKTGGTIYKFTRDQSYGAATQQLATYTQGTATVGQAKIKISYCIPE